MNYFSHYVALPELGDAYLALGSIVPDLLRDSKPNYTFLAAFQSSNQSYSALASGIQHHIEIDRLFHNSSFFKKHTKFISKSIRDSKNISISRYTYFLAHLLLELHIDKTFIEQMPNLLNKFYGLLGETKDHDLAVFFNEQLPNNDFELFMKKKALFLDHSFLYRYTEKGFIISAVNSIIKKIGIPAISLEDQQYFDLLMEEEIAPIINGELTDFFKALKAKV